MGLGSLILSLVVITLALAGLLAWRRPDWFIRLLLWVPIHLIYRLRVHGRENIPAQGPALLVCNHVSFIDSCLVFMAQRRPIHFVVWAPYLRVPGLKLLLRFTQVIPI